MPGTIQNDSSHTILITGDTWENGQLVWKEFDLKPTEKSTKYLCDTDYMASEHVAWQWGWAFIIQPGWWSAYLLNMRVRCVNHTVNGTASFRCYGEGWNFGPQQ